MVPSLAGTVGISSICYWLFILCCGLKLIAHSGNSADILRIFWVWFQFLSQATYENTKILSFFCILRSPDPAQQHAMGKNLIHIKHQFSEEIIFSRCQFDLTTGNSYLPFDKVNP